MYNQLAQMDRTIDDDEITVELEDLLKNTPNLQLPDPTLVQFYDDLKNRILLLDTAIDSNLLVLTNYILQWNKEDTQNGIPISGRKPIKLLIYSYGGLLDACMHFMDIIALSQTPIYTYNLGVAMSAGLYILLAGHKRYGLAHSQFLIHSGSGGSQGTFEQSEKQMAHYRVLIDYLRDFVIQRTSISKTLYAKKKTTEWYMLAEEAKQYGIIDDIITDINQLF